MDLLNSESNDSIVKITLITIENLIQY